MVFFLFENGGVYSQKRGSGFHGSVAKGVGNYCISILLIAFTLNRLSYILFVVLLSVLFARQKARIERLEENSSEQLRLRLAGDLNGERKQRTQ